MLLGSTSFAEIKFRGWYEPLPIGKGGRDRWVVRRSPVVAIAGVELEVRDGYETDFSSIPRLALWKFSPAGRDAVPAIFHDYGLTETDIPKRDVDTLYLALMHAEGIPDLEAVIKYLTVRTKPEALRRS